MEFFFFFFFLFKYFLSRIIFKRKEYRCSFRTYELLFFHLFIYLFFFFDTKDDTWQNVSNICISIELFHLISLVTLSLPLLVRKLYFIRS